MVQLQKGALLLENLGHVIPMYMGPPPFFQLTDVRKEVSEEGLCSVLFTSSLGCSESQRVYFKD